MDRPWISSYPAGVRWDITIDAAPAWRLLDDAANRWPEHFALDSLGRRLKYRELRALAARAAAGLQEIGVQPGDRVGLYLPNSPHYPIAFFGALMAGAVVVNYSPLDANATLAHKIADSDTGTLVTLDVDPLYSQAVSLLGSTRLKTLVVGSLADFAAQPMPAARELPRESSQRRFLDLLENDGRFAPHRIEDPASEVALLQYTGGTTGAPKGAMLTHGNICAAAAQCEETTQGNEPTIHPGTERVLLVLPVFHVFAELVMFLGIKLGAELVLHLKFDAAAIANDIVTKKISAMFGVPTMFVALLAHARAHGVDLSSLTHCGSGGAPLPTEMIEPFRQATGVTLTDGWGMSETTAVGTFTPRHGRRKAGSCGIPFPRVDIKIVALDDANRELAAGEHGEICIRGPNVMRGYWKNAAASAAALTPDGFLRSGDVGCIDADGFVFIIERCKDMLLCGGFNVYPTVIEDAIYAHPDVAEVCVIGIADDYRGQSPKAFVRMKEGAAPLTLEALQIFLADRVGKHEMVKALELRDELPKTPVGKLSKLTLYEEERQRTAYKS